MCMQEKVWVCAVVVVKTKCMFKKRRLNKKLQKKETLKANREKERLKIRAPKL